MKKNNLFKNFKFVYSYIIKYDKIILFYTFILIILSGFSTFGTSYILKQIINSIEFEMGKKFILNEVIFLSLGLTILLIVKEFLDREIYWRWDKIFFKVVTEKNKKVMFMDYEYLEDPKTQDLIKRADQSMNFYQGFGGLYYNFRYLFEAIISFVIASFILSSINNFLIIIILILIILKYLISDKTNKIDKEKYQDAIIPLKRKTRYISSISRNQVIGKDMRIYQMPKFIVKEHISINKELKKLYYLSIQRWFKAETIIKFLILVEELVLYYFLIREVILNHLSIGYFTFMLSSIRILSNSLTKVFSNYAKLRQYSRGVNDLRLIMNNYNHENSCNNILPLDGEYVIEFKNVSFKYFKQKNFVLNNISFKLDSKKKIALVGLNGAGKTTLIKLLMGLYKPTSGEIIINGININNINREEYYKLFAPVFQETNILANTVACNVSMKHKNDTDYFKVEKSLKLAGLYDKIESLPLGIHTELSREFDSSGIDLSGGEKQKIALARAIYKESPIIILDEPTASLDAIAEYNLYNNFNKVIDNKSAIYISHRLSSTRFCDQILFLDGGTIIESGTHDQLMANNGEYKKLFNTQAQYYKED